MKEPSVPPITSAFVPDLEAVRAFILAMVARGAIGELVAAILALLVRMRDLNSGLMAKLASKSRKRPPSETLRRLQLELPFGLSSPANDTKPPAPKKKKKRGPKKPDSHGRPVFPEHLARVPEWQPVSDEKRMCPKCGVEAASISFKMAEKLDVRPAEFIVRQIQRETCACQNCHEYATTAPKQDEVLDRGVLGNELLIQAMVDHYDDAVPWERMERSARDQGVPLSANTLAASVGRLIDLCDPIVEHIKDSALSSDFAALDATGMPVLDPDHPLGIRHAALWLVEGEHRYAYFFYAPTGHADWLEKALAGCSFGSVMCDGSSTNNCVDRAGGKRGGCNAHARRKLVEALRLGDKRAAKGIEHYAAIFHVDAESKRHGETLEQRFLRRQQDSVPLVDKLRTWLDERLGDVEPKSSLGQALGYMARQWERLTLFLRDPCMELTNNEVERGLRRWVLDRKTWLFVGHEQSAHRAAAALSILTTCRAMGIEPRRYLRETLAKLLAGEKDLKALLPETHAQKLAEERDAAEAAAQAAQAAQSAKAALGHELPGPRRALGSLSSASLTSPWMASRTTRSVMAARCAVSSLERARNSGQRVRF